LMRPSSLSHTTTPTAKTGSRTWAIHTGHSDTHTHTSRVNTYCLLLVPWHPLVVLPVNTPACHLSLVYQLDCLVLALLP
jgi:hypothetical protein